MTQFYNLPCGQTIPPDNIHAVSVSMPRVKDVIGYEENDPRVMKKIKSGYPRFVHHPYLSEIRGFLHEKFEIEENEEVVLISSRFAVEELQNYIGSQFKIIEDQNVIGICVNNNFAGSKNIRKFLQHTGYIPSSRLAEQYLFENGLISTKFNEEQYSLDDPQKFILQTLRDAYELEQEDYISLGICGMNPIYAAYKSLEKIQHENGRNVFIQFGWLYLDTIEILKKFSSNHASFESNASISKLEKFLEQNGNQVAAIFTEVTTNPLIQTPDLPALYKLARHYDIPVIVDATFGTPYNVEVLQHSDVVIESLTKFACGNADVMMGAIIVKASSPYYFEIVKNIPSYLESPFEGDLRRLAFEIKTYQSRIQKINQNALVLLDYFSTNKKIKEMYWPYQELTKANYLALHKHADAVGGVISIVFDEPFQNIYDNIKFPKGPSLGTEFTLLMPYVYLAHYDLVLSREGRNYLRSAGIHPELIRVSVGFDNVETSIGLFEQALS